MRISDDYLFFVEPQDANELSILHYSDEFCPKCEKLIEEAKKEIEDRQAQVSFFFISFSMSFYE